MSNRVLTADDAFWVSKLSANEELRWTGRPSKRFRIKGISRRNFQVALMFGGACIAVSTVIPKEAQYDQAVAGQFRTALWIIGATFLTVVPVVLDHLARFSQRYALTNRRALIAQKRMGEWFVDGFSFDKRSTVRTASGGNVEFWATGEANDPRAVAGLIFLANDNPTEIVESASRIAADRERSV